MSGVDPYFSANDYKFTFFLKDNKAIISKIEQFSATLNSILEIPDVIPVTTAFTSSVGKTITGITNFAAYSLRTKAIQTLKLPNTLSYIGKGTFASFTSLKTIDFGTNPILSSIGENAFRYCGELDGNIAFPNTITTIGSFAFYGCASLPSISFLSVSKLATIGEKAFFGCGALNGTIDFPDSLITIGIEAFSNCVLIPSITFQS